MGKAGAGKLLSPSVPSKGKQRVVIAAGRAAYVLLAVLAAYAARLIFTHRTRREEEL